jgi:hypothetical protein
VPLEMQAGLAVKPTATEAWEAIRQVHVGADRVKKANAERLRREFGDITFKTGETVEDFSLRLNTVASQLRVQFSLAELTLQLTVDPSKSRRQEPTVDPSKSRRSIPARADGKSRRLIPTKNLWLEQITKSC